MQDIANWIKSQDYVKIDRKSSGLCMLEPEVVQHLENVIDEFQKNKISSKRVTMQIKPYLLYNVSFLLLLTVQILIVDLQSNTQTTSLSPDPNSTFDLFNRVVNVRPSYTVPVGRVGTIVAIHKTSESNDNDVLFDVVFDIPFTGGLDLGCSANRGYRLPRHALINKSYGQRQFEEKTGKLCKTSFS